MVGDGEGVLAEDVDDAAGGVDSDFFSAVLSVLAGVFSEAFPDVVSELLEPLVAELFSELRESFR